MQGGPIIDLLRCAVLCFATLNFTTNSIIASWLRHALLRSTRLHFAMLRITTLHSVQLNSTNL